MFRSLVWKEYRQQRWVWLALASVPLIGIPLLVNLTKPEGLPTDRYTVFGIQIILILCLVLAAMDGAVCGALLLAEERESGTLRSLMFLIRPGHVFGGANCGWVWR